MSERMPDADVLYQALLEKDSDFEGIFVAGVTTTGIFCRPTCTARKPKRENVEYFPTARDALQNGYRACKVCHPLELQGATPDWLKPLLREIDEAPRTRLRNKDLQDRGIDPSRVRRWFKKHHGMTFQEYQRTLRIGQAFGRIKHGEGVTETALDSGYESLSGFVHSFKKSTGFPPRESERNQPIVVTRILTSLGPMLAGATEEGICLLEFIDRRMLETQLQRLRDRLKAELVPGSNVHLDELHRQLDAYFAGTRKEFSVPLVVPGTIFQKEVWAGLRTIPYGTTRSYQEQAEMIGRPNAVRAVARANGDNRIAIVIPCHRVIGKDGKLTGYGGGLWRKEHLLNHEMGNL